ncbi:DNA-dependent ATPase fun30 [Diatrype stigma]|uniref:DNA-dependent ATPase fun30 n=1 Tax=Diatrype stigma TaxID=117547 RepID=A0AAN9YW35_9PEZI
MNAAGGTFLVPGTPGMKRQEQKSRDLKRIELEDDDIDELASDDIPCSSPFFTQPTQIIGKGTQPTQIISRGTQPTQIIGKGTQPTQIIAKGTQPTQVINRTTLRQSSPSSPSTPSSAIEVPASSPFQPKSQSKTASADMSSSNSKPVARGSIASLMAPAGTSFRSPSTNQTSTNRPGANKASTAAKAKYFTISDDDLNNDYKKQESSGDEAPMRGDIRPSSFVKKDTASGAGLGSTRMPKEDITLNEIHDLRLRHLTKDVYRIVSKSKPSITIRACRDTLMKGVGWQVSTAVDSLIGKSNKTQAPASSKSSFSKSVDLTEDNDIDPTSNKSNKSFPGTTAQSRNSRPTEPQQKAKVQSSLLDLDRFAYNKNNPHSLTSTSEQPAPPRRRLIQGRRNKSPSPPPVFSVSSSATSPPTSPAASPASSQSTAKMAITTTVPPQAGPAVKRRRLVQGRRAQAQPQPITIDSDSDDEFLTTPAVNSRKRKISPSPKIETPTPPIDVPSDENSDAGELLVGERQQVLKYLNSCSVDELSRMTGLPEDAKLMIQARPFATLAQAERISRKEKAKSKRKSSRAEVGLVIVEKLAAWFQAFEAAATVIKECEERGATLQSIMATWPMDKNGCMKPNSDLSELPISAKPSLMAEDVQLKSYQLLGLNWMNLLHSKGYSGILADDMGLGKTCQVISFIAQLVDSYMPPDEEDSDHEDEEDNGRAPWPNLIVVPPSTYENWLSEFERFAPEISVMPYYGSDRRNIDPEEAQNYHVVLTTYTQVERQHEDLQFLQELNPHAAIFDEGHKLKNPKTLIYKKMMRVPSDWRLILSGTPVQNNLKELLSVLHFVEPDLFEGDDFERLQTIFEAKVPSKDVHNFAALAKERVGNARTIMAPFILQRRKDDVIDLAKKTERNIVVDMHPEQKLIYNEIKGTYLHQPKTAKRGAAASTIKSGNSWIQLKKAAIHHQLFRRHFTDSRVKEMVDLLWKHCSEDELYVQSKEDRHKALLLADFKEKSDFELHTWCKEFKKYIGHLDVPDRSWEDSPKVKKLLELVRGYQKTGDRVLVFSRFEMVINVLRDTLYFAGIPYCELTGQTNTADRFPEIQKFNADPTIPVFLLTTGAGGTGLNLTAANKIVLFDQSDNPQDDVQASNRAHRIGQTRDVEVVRLITRDTVEGLIYNSCVKKLMLAACVEGQFGAGGADGDDEEVSVEEECRKLMLLESEVEATTTTALTKS